MVLDVTQEGLLCFRCRALSSFDVSLDDVVVLMEACSLGVEGVSGLVEPGDVNWDDSVNVRKGSGHFSDFFEDNVMSEG